MRFDLNWLKQPTVDGQFITALGITVQQLGNTFSLMNKYINLRAFILFLGMTFLIGFFISSITSMNYIGSCLIVAAGILLNGLIIIALGDKDE